MNIKTITSPVTPIENSLKAEPTKAVKSEAAFADKEGNGRRDPDEQPTKQHLSEEELEQAMDHIREMKGFKDHNLRLRMEKNDVHTIVYLEDPNGKLVRRLTEPELWVLIRDQSKRTGQFFDKAM